MVRALLPGLLTTAFLATAQACVAQGYTVVEDPAWTNLFDTTSGWTGADGIFALPLDGDERPGGLARTDTLFVFSDTFIGDVTPGGQRVNAQMVNNTLGFLPRNGFQQGAKFFWDDRGAQPGAIVVPSTAQSEAGDWYWFADGIVLDGQAHVLAQRMRQAPGAPGFGFARSGMALVSFPTTGPADLGAISQVDAPLSYPETDQHGGAFFGAGIMPNTVESGAPNPDGYIYVYGSREDPLVKKLLVARVPRDDFADFSEWRYWNGHSWVADLRNAIPVTGRISNELSVTPTPSGDFALIFSLDTVSGRVAMKRGPSPVGPWGPAEVLWEIQTPPGIDVFTYNAKAHPHLSAPGTLLISWNVNAVDFWDHFRYADIYRPRFLTLTWQ